MSTDCTIFVRSRRWRVQLPDSVLTGPIMSASSPPALRPGAALAGLSLLLALGGCPSGASLTPEYGLPRGEEHTFAFRWSQTTQTEVGSLPEWADRYDRAPLLESLAEFDTALEGELVRERVRTFPDGTAGVLVRLRRLAAPDTIDQQQVEPVFEALDGRSLAVRMWPSGQLLDFSGWEHLTGHPSLGPDVAGLIHGALLRLPARPDVDGSVAFVTLNLPLGPASTEEQRWQLTWTRAGDAACGSATCQSYTLAGQALLSGRSNARDRAMQIEGSAELSATLHYDPDAREIAWVQFERTAVRDVETLGPEEAVVARLNQTTTSRGELTWQR